MNNCEFNTLLASHIENKEVSLLSELLSNQNFTLDFKNKYLCDAVKTNCLDIVKLLLNDSYYDFIENDNNYSIQTAYFENKENIVKLLMSNKKIRDNLSNGTTINQTIIHGKLKHYYIKKNIENF